MADDADIVATGLMKRGRIGARYMVVQREIPLSRLTERAPVLRTGEVHFAGLVPNRQHFIVNPSLNWLIADTAATLDALALGEVGPASIQRQHGDFRIPQRGIFAIKRAFFEPASTDILRVDAVKGGASTP